MDTDRTHVLIVDDAADTADSTAELLSLWGYDPRPCYDGASALEFARARCPDVVLLDIGMPVMDGFRFVGLFRSLPRCGTVPVIAVSGYTGAVFAARARSVGINHYLLKPADPEQLRELLSQQMELATARPRWGPGEFRELVTADTGRHCNAPKSEGRE